MLQRAGAGTVRVADKPGSWGDSHAEPKNAPYDGNGVPYRQAAAELGYRAGIAYFPQGQSESALDERPIAQVELVPDAAVEKDPLFTAILARRTSRLPYDLGRLPGEAALGQLEASGGTGMSVGTTIDEVKVREIRDLATRAWETEWASDGPRRETIRVTQVGRSAVDARPWGITLDDRFVSTMGRLGFMDGEAMDDPASRAYRETLSFYAKSIAATPAFLWLTSPDNTRATQIEVGRAWVRIQLKATSLGLSFQPLSQALQEFSEMAPHYRAAHELLGRRGETVQLLARIGYGPAIGPAPREALASKLVPMGHRERLA
ncbi:MAG: hypothetical protein AAFY29_16605 [Pseudomonadota bacterium]